ncbi:MAG: Vitamin B12 dependent methionine synthase activation subunit [Ruminococcus sp.]|nr:Vitamin B12 dependent methionine synthase activation subunit [Ruminococcus sp.]
MIIRESFTPPLWNRGEIARYARAKADDERIASLIDECIAEAEAVLDYRVCYAVSGIERNENTLCFDGITTESKTLTKALSGCERLVMFAATVGAPFDRLIARYSRLEPSKALILQAIGAERVESLCDVFCAKMNTELIVEKKSLRTRVSPGYGDIPLTMQTELFGILDCERKIGLTLNESLLMSPSKSVTAIAGIGAARCDAISETCTDCQKTDCVYRR